MEERMAKQIAEILKEPDFHMAEKALAEIDTPKDVPFSYARNIWNRNDTKKEEYQTLLEEIRSYPIAPVNKAKISDFLWVVENDFSNAQIAETAYCEHLKNPGVFADHIMAINRMPAISWR